MGPNQLDITLSKGRKVALTAHNRISADGKTRTINVNGTDMQGKPIDAVVVYDKQ